MLNIIDKSGDKKYFTIIPNFIANHSTANDQALYFQMKRFAGETGKCFASEKTLMEKLGIGRTSLKKSIKYLLDRKWIKYIGDKMTQTKGGLQSIKTYEIVDIWKVNNECYDGVAEIEPLEDKGVSETAGGGVQNDIKGVAETAPNKNPLKKEPFKKYPREGEASQKTNKQLEEQKQIKEIDEIINHTLEVFNLDKLDGSFISNRVSARQIINQVKGLENAKQVITLSQQHNYWGNKITRLSTIEKNMRGIMRDLQEDQIPESLRNDPRFK